MAYFYNQYKSLTDVDEFDADNIIFDSPRDEEVAGNKNIKGKRIKIGIRKNGKIGELIIPTVKLHSFMGIRPTKPYGREDSDEIIGYNIPLSLHSKTDVNDKDKLFIDVFRQIIDKTKNHVVDVKKQIGQPHLTKEMLYKWDNMLYEKRDENGNSISEFGPTFYAKLMYNKAKNSIMTTLVDKRGRALNIEDILLKSCDVIACIKFESIYINSNGCSLQVKVSEAIIDIQKKDAAKNLLLLSHLAINDDNDDTASESSEDESTPNVAADDDIIHDSDNISCSEDEDDTPATKDAKETIISSDSSDEEEIVEETPPPSTKKKATPKRTPAAKKIIII